MVAFLRAAADYQFVILVFGWGGFGFPEFISWQAQRRPTVKTKPESLFTHRKESIMKFSPLFTAIALSFAAAAGPVLAQEATYEFPQAATSKTTRAEVLADLAQTRAQGRLEISEAYAGVKTPAVHGDSREALRAEAQVARRNGYIWALTAEPQGFTVAAPKAATRMIAAAR